MWKLKILNLKITNKIGLTNYPTVKNKELNNLWQIYQQDICQPR